MEIAKKQRFPTTSKKDVFPDYFGLCKALLVEKLIVKNEQMKSETIRSFFHERNN
jgi:hypothetical protein